eukprot:2250810-Pleurochrysis_carterae.AAC.1
MPFKTVWPDALFYNLATWLEAVDIHNEKLANRLAKRKAVAASEIGRQRPGRVVRPSAHQKACASVLPRCPHRHC